MTDDETGSRSKNDATADAVTDAASESDNVTGKGGEVAENGESNKINPCENGSIYREYDSAEAEKLEEASESAVSTSDVVGGGTADKKKLEVLEIDTSLDESIDEENADMRGLLGGDSKAKKELTSQRRQLVCGCLAKPERVGNLWIFLPAVFARTGWGIAGPNCVGPICVIGLIAFASHYFIQISITRIGPITAAICILFTMASVYHFANWSFRDPGIVKLQPGSNQAQQGSEDRRLQFRWCDICQCFQPPDGAHCSDCNGEFLSSNFVLYF